jgi:hypothetical protein
MDTDSISSIVCGSAQPTQTMIFTTVSKAVPLGMSSEEILSGTRGRQVASSRAAK